MQNAAVLVVVHLVERIDAAEQRHLIGGAVGAVDDQGHRLARGQIVEAEDVEGFVTHQLQRVAVGASLVRILCRYTQFLADTTRALKQISQKLN